MKNFKAIISALTLSVMPLAGVSAYDGHWHGDIHHFHEYDAGRWHSGYWSNSFHGGRNGWWWVVGGEWYFYPAPVYPYPDPYIPPTVVVQQPAGVQQYWFCNNPQGYYPYVSACYEPWRAVAGNAAVAPQPQQPPAEVHSYAQPPIEDSDVRTGDDRQLNAFAAEYYKINASDGDAAAHLKNLKARVEAFRQTLFDRDYKAMDILRDTEKLEHKISAKQKQVSAL